MRIYLDNQLITYWLRGKQGKSLNPNIEKAVEALETLFKRKDVELLVSEESLAEIRKLNQTSQKRKDLEAMYFKLKQRKSVIRNSAVLWSDPIATWNSPDVYYDHPYKDTDLNKVKQFLASKGNTNDFDTRYIANAMLSENKIDVFLTFDKSSLWRHRNEIKRLFGVEVKLPSEI